LDRFVEAGHHPNMPTIELDDSEIQNATQACRIAAVQAEQDAAKQTSPTVRATFEAAAKRYRDSDLAFYFSCMRSSEALGGSPMLLRAL
jgi:hypothetical protein